MLEARRLQDPELQEGTCVHLKTPQAHKGHHPPPAASAALIDVTAPFLKGLFFPLEKSSLKSSFVKGSGDILKMLTRWIIFFSTVYLCNQKRKQKEKYKVMSIHYSILFLSLVSLGFPWNPEESLVTGTAIHAHTSTNLPGISLSAKVPHCLHKKFTVWVLFHFPWPRVGGSAGQYRLEHQQRFPVHFFGINWWEGKTFSSENWKSQSRASCSGLELVKIFQLKIKLCR